MATLSRWQGGHSRGRVSSGTFLMFFLGVVLWLLQGGLVGAAELTVLHTNSVTGHMFACPS